MSAEPWEYFVPVQPDVSHALRELQDDVFERGAFEKPYAEIDILDGLDFFTASDDEREAMISDYGLAALRKPLEDVGIRAFRQWILRLDAAARVETREELDVLRCLSAQGTRSVLDMEGLADQVKPGHVTPLPLSDIQRFFGTDRPTHEMVERNMDFHDSIGRGEGVCITVYRSDAPAEIFFSGYSFDYFSAGSEAIHA
jgi:hypothetical protein